MSRRNVQQMLLTNLDDLLITGLSCMFFWTKNCAPLAEPFECSPPEAAALVPSQLERRIEICISSLITTCNTGTQIGVRPIDVD